MATHVALAGTNPIVPHEHALVRRSPSRPIPVVAGILYLTPVADRRLVPADDGRDPLRTATGAAIDQFLELGAAAYPLFDDSFGKLGIAQLKVLSPDPGIRVIGGFAAPAVFVGLRIYWRDELPFKPTRQRGVIDYKTLGREAAADWAALIPGVRRVPMKEFHDDL